ncbi:hypothetical protein NUACC21_18750 [Scytonema sp. NUACC21]
MSQQHKCHRLKLMKLFSTRNLLPILVGICVSIAVVFLYQRLLVQECATIEKLVQQQAIAFETKLSAELDTRILALERLGRRWQVRGGTPQKEWEADATAYVKDYKGYRALEWVDPSLQVRWIVPLAGNETVQNLDLTKEPRRRVALEASRKKRQTTFTRTINLVQGGEGFLAYVPLFVDNKFDGFIVGVFQVQSLLDAILQVPQGYKLRVFDSDELIYSQNSQIQERSRSLFGGWNG